PATRINPLYHFMKIGGKHGLDPNPLFDTSWYLEINSDVSAAGDNALVHYLTHGWKEGRNPHPGFDNDWYLKENPDDSHINPLIHYVTFGRSEGRPPKEVPAPELVKIQPSSDEMAIPFIARWRLEI